jgi:hypothetical protein
MGYGILMPRTKKSPKSKPAPAGYSKRSLADKLGIKEGMTKAIMGAPTGFDALIGTHGYDDALEFEAYDYLHFFSDRKLALEQIFPILAKRLKQGGILWISWPKKSSGMQTDLRENVVRDLGLVTGLVDVKVCAIDETWSGLKFMHRTASQKK